MREKVQERIAELERLKIQIDNRLKKVPEGHLRTVNSKHKYAQYYWIKKEWEDEYPTGKYIRKEDIDVAKKLAQKEYDLKMLELLEGEINMLKKYQKHHFEEKLIENYTKLGIVRKSMVAPLVLSDEDYIAKWKEENKSGQNTYAFQANFYTDNGEQVRSKSEMLIANRFIAKDIPYIYEPALSGLLGTKYPDFLVLNKRTRKSYYFEHFGMIDDKDYAEDMQLKLDWYSYNGYFPGINLLFTMECKKNPLDIRNLDRLIKEFLT